MAIPKRTLAFTAGQTVLDTILWAGGALQHVKIKDIILGLPTRIVCEASHSILSTAVSALDISNVKSPKQLNGKKIFAIGVNSTTVDLYNHNSAEFEPYSGGGSISYLPPLNLTGYTIRALFRRSVSSAVLLEATSVAGPNAFFTITSPGLIGLAIPPSFTRLLIGSSNSTVSGIAQIEATDSLGRVYRPWDYEWAVSPEGTVE